MKTTDFRGIGGVYRYTLSQSVKTKSFLITLFITLFFALCSFPFLSWKNGITASKGKDIHLTTIYVFDESGMKGLKFEDALKDKDITASIKFEAVVSDFDKIKDNILENHENSASLHFYYDDALGTYVINMGYDSDSEVTEDEIMLLSSYFNNYATDYKISSLNLDESIVTLVSTNMEYSVTRVSEFLGDDEEPEVIGQNDYWLVYASIFLIYMLVAITAGTVSSSIVEEKTNRIVEYLMTSVRPMALIMGKILAKLTVSIGQLSLIFLCTKISGIINQSLFDADSNDILSRYFSTDAVSAISVVNIIICLIMAGLGILMFCLIAGLFAATATKMEELQQSMGVYTLILLVSFIMCFVGLTVMTTAGFNGFVSFLLYFPFTSVMILPGAILTGNAGIVTTIIGLILQIITAALLLKFVSLCYETVIVTNGSRITLKQLVNIASAGKKSAGKEIK